MRHARTLIAVLGGLIAVTACTSSSGTTPTAGVVASPSSGAAIKVEVRDFELEPASVTSTGATVTFAVTNTGPTPHNVKVRTESGTVLFGTSDLREGESETVSAAMEPGSYVLFCSLAGHESLGIKGTLTVGAR